MAILEVRNLSKHYRLGSTIRHDTLRDAISYRLSSLVRGGAGGDSGKKGPSSIWALRDVSFDLEEGEVLGVIGANGAGKSTLLKILSSISEPTSGEARIRARVGSLLEVGTGFHPELTGKENIYLNGAILGMRQEEIRRKYDEITAFAEVDDFLDTPVKRYSSGMYVRLAFAVAAHLDPEILLVDEVLAVGDLAFQRKCLRKMDDVVGGGRAILFVSHNMGAVRALCHRTLWIDKGSVAAIGETGSVVSRYFESASRGACQGPSRASGDEPDFEVIRVALRNGSGEYATTFDFGSDITVEIEYRARKRITSPFFWVSVVSQHGPLFAANMQLDDLRPEYIEGEGTLACTFREALILPQGYSVNVGARHRDGQQLLMPTMHGVVYFQVRGTAREIGLPGERADMIMERTTPMVVPYEWRFPQGRVAKPEWITRKENRL